MIGVDPIMPAESKEIADFKEKQAAVFLAHLEPDGRSHLLRDHLLSVSEAAGRMSGKIGIGAAGAAIGLLHDLGKYSGDFQRYLRGMQPDQDTEQQEPKRGMIDHSTAGAQTIWRSLKRLGIQEGIVGEMLALCVASHHSGLIDCIAPSGSITFRGG
jgi:CRISPR-associated endonuclease/helicase Cas3